MLIADALIGALLQRDQRGQLATLRHTAATFLRAGGADVKSAQAILGHAKASHTLDLYADSVPGSVDAAMVKLGRAF